MEIVLSQNQFAVVDEADVALVSAHKWHALKTITGRYYAQTNLPRVKGRSHSMLYMHTLILGVKGADHIDGNGLNNQRSNLRTANKSQNSANVPKVRVTCSSAFKGVAWHKAARKFRAYISSNKKQTHLGLFDSELAAAQAYDRAAEKRFGVFSKLNFK